MRFLTTMSVLLVFWLFTSCLFAEEIIRNNDIIAVTGTVAPCEDFGRFVAWRTRVIDDVIVIDHQTIQATGVSTRKLQESLERIMGPMLGTRLSSIRVEIISAEQRDKSKTDSCGTISDAIKACDKRIQEFKEKGDNLALVS